MHQSIQHTTIYEIHLLLLDTFLMRASFQAKCGINEWEQHFFRCGCDFIPTKFYPVLTSDLKSRTFSKNSVECWQWLNTVYLLPSKRGSNEPIDLDFTNLSYKFTYLTRIIVTQLTHLCSRQHGHTPNNETTFLTAKLLFIGKDQACCQILYIGFS